MLSYIYNNNKYFEMAMTYGHDLFALSFKYYLKHEYRSVLSDIKREAQPSVLYLIKHDNECFE
jgi:hypothetical protein